MKRFTNMLLTVAMVGVVGCATLGLPSADTFDQKAFVAQASVTQIRTSAAQLLGTKTISVTDAENALVVTDAASKGIEVARNIYTTACPPAVAAPAVPCTSVPANNRLAVATAALTALSAYLATQQGVTK